MALPNMNIGSNGGYTGDASVTPQAGVDKFLFPIDDDELDQDYQTPGQSGLAKWRFSNVYPIQRLTLQDVDNMVDASNEYLNKIDNANQGRVRKNFEQFRLEAQSR
jgi:hypothetical protein|tara:strand:+ start:2270 stop:2587 length:318 start_codon:yes stop_codon:yes gene_type:complete